MNKISYFRDDKLPIFEIKSCDSGIHSSKDHSHEELSIGIIEKGSSTVNCGEKSYNVDSRTAVIIYPGVIHKCTPTSIESWKFSMLYLKKDWIESVFDTELKSENILVKELMSRDIYRMIELFAILRKDISNIEKESRLITDIDYLLNMESYVLKNFSSRHTDKDSIKMARKYIDDNFLEKITLDDLTRYSNLSKYHTLRLFKLYFNTTPHSYQTLLRLNYAKKLLKDKKDISDIAQDLGFYDQSHFSKSFKQYFGVTPLKYKVT
ncbi:transcriptional regulator, AraC family [Gottschalkia acidurici 9a]|uniref:Transcriptional regulator, AraC family n=1 Tax=Gottschalkia acidurici (strain ATCC 7906 / DSM 604 / BCRC 14475 / CIP 104303 / KCTC 5404 / NCIMB 10678 / 9a) TaxID=1128398 RepID=K0B389_GOTA9|nr:AraC family transcriptional regulator [Gottschalkia acidurici]AFS79647.1 transcriptional regulator, AraC family [Gottschalkia acidurici 9a]